MDMSNRDVSILLTSAKAPSKICYPTPRTRPILFFAWHAALFRHGWAVSLAGTRSCKEVILLVARRYQLSILGSHQCTMAQRVSLLPLRLAECTTAGQSGPPASSGDQSEVSACR